MGEAVWGLEVDEAGQLKRSNVKTPGYIPADSILSLLSLSSPKFTLAHALTLRTGGKPSPD
jgi:hypothetical protein